MKNYVRTGADGFDFVEYQQAMQALQRLRAKAKDDDDLEVVLLFIVRALQILLEKQPNDAR